MKKMMMVTMTMLAVFSATSFAGNILSIVHKSATSIEVQLQNTDAVAGLQFSIRASSDIVLSDPTGIDRTSSSSWTVASYKPNDSTINVVIISMQQSSLTTGSGSLIQVPFSSIGASEESHINLADVKLAAPDAGVIDVTVRGARWTNNSTIADADNGRHSFTLGQNYPNPFNPTTRITYTLHMPAQVQLSIYDITGREVNRLVDQYQEAGAFSATFNSANNNGQALTSGMYFARLIVGSESATRKMVLMK